VTLTFVQSVSSETREDATKTKKDKEEDNCTVHVTCMRI